MALRFVKEPDGESGHVIATARLCLTEDRSRLVPESDPDARWLFCVPGAPIKREDAERYGLLAGGDAEEPEPEPDPEPEKARPAPPNKARARAANKGSA